MKTLFIFGCLVIMLYIIIFKICSLNFTQWPVHNNKVERKYDFYVIYNSPYDPLHQKCFICLANVAHHRRQFVLVSNYNNITYVLIYTAVAR